MSQRWIQLLPLAHGHLHLLVHRNRLDNGTIRENSSLDDHNDAILDDIAILLLVGLLHVGTVDDLAIAANAGILVDDALPHCRVCACKQHHHTST